MYDYLIVGAGLYGVTCANLLSERGFRCVVIDKRPNVGGNCHTEERDGIMMHMHGPHIFHTSDEEVWAFVNRYAHLAPFRYSPVAVYQGHTYSLPVNMWTFSNVYGVTRPDQVQRFIPAIEDPKNLEDQAISMVGREVYDRLIYGYTRKQWNAEPKDLPASIIKRLPVRYTYDDNYFTDRWQGIPTVGYTEMIRRMIMGVDVITDQPYDRSMRKMAREVIYTGTIDGYFGNRLGALGYRSLEFVHSKEDTENYQGTAVMNYTDSSVSYTRIIEHRHFSATSSPVTWVTTEYPQDHTPENEPYYPVNNESNSALHHKYTHLAANERGVHFGGRLGSYRYMNMDTTIRQAMDFCRNITHRKP